MAIHQIDITTTETREVEGETVPFYTVSCSEGCNVGNGGTISQNVAVSWAEMHEITASKKGDIALFKKPRRARKKGSATPKPTKAKETTGPMDADIVLIVRDLPGMTRDELNKYAEDLVDILRGAGGDGQFALVVARKKREK